MDDLQWVPLAKRRCLRVLRTRRFASARQLEKKISEAGRADTRPEPMKLSTAVAELMATAALQRELIPGLTTFYKPADFGGAADDARRLTIIELTRKFLAITRNPQACGKALERVVHTAAIHSGRYTVLGTPDHPPAQGFAINGYVLEKECDHILIPKDFAGPKLVVEDKNLREWLHPSAEEVWSVIGKALRIPHSIPILICRKMHYVAFSLFSKIGLACWQTYRQYFSPELVTEAVLAPIRHTDGLGFSDVTTDLTPPVPLLAFLASIVPNNIDLFAERFESCRALPTHYAIAERLETDALGTARRNQLFEEFRRDLPPDA